MVRLLLVLFVAWAASGCVSSRAVSRSCNMPLVPLTTEHPQSVKSLDAGSSIETVSTLFERALAEKPAPAGEMAFLTVPPRRLLFLSGGSQKGAFGAGFLAGWADSRNRRLPDFDIVTGVSAGAILSTAAFVGDAYEPARYFGDINHERDVLTPYVKMRDGDIAWYSYPALISHNALGDLAPMRERLLTYLNRPVLERVASKGRDPTKRLLVGAVDVDSGQAVAFDLTELARRFVSGGEFGGEVARQCYADAVLASSSVPMAAKPTFIDNRLYIDGGARFGVFQEALVEELQRKAREAPAPLKSVPPQIYVVINGTQEVGPLCDKLKDPCKTVATGGAPLQHQHPDWTLADLAKRSVSILINQVYRFSAQVIEFSNRLAYPTAEGRNFHFARIKGADDFPFTTKGETKSCKRWYEADQQKLNPIEFYPDYMKCLVAYGRQRGRAAAW